MGCVSSSVDESDSHQKKKKCYLDEKGRDISSGNFRLMLLGGGQCGRSTFCQQLRVLYNEEDFSSLGEREVYRELIHCKIVYAISELCLDVLKYLQQPVDKENRERIERIVAFNERYRLLELQFLSSNLTRHALQLGYYVGHSRHGALQSPRPTFLVDEKSAEGIRLLWNDSIIQECWQQKKRESVGLFLQSTQIHSRNLVPFLGYFMEHFHRIFATIEEEEEEEEKKEKYCISYIPTTEDILRCGLDGEFIEEFLFQIGDNTFDLYENRGILPRTGRERNHLKHLARSAVALYFISMDVHGEYWSKENFLLPELSDLEGFKQFSPTKIIVFLTKCDVFRETIKKENISLSSLFPGFKGSTYEEAIEFMKEKMFENDPKNRMVSVIEMNCMDVGDVKYGFESVLGTLFSSTTVKSAITSFSPGEEEEE